MHGALKLQERQELSKRGFFYIIRETECHATYTISGNTPPWHNTCHDTAHFSEEKQSSAQAAHPPWHAHACSISCSARICACAWVKAYVFLSCGSWPRPFPTSCWNSVVDMSKVPWGRPSGPETRIAYRIKRRTAICTQRSGHALCVTKLGSTYTHEERTGT